MNKAEIKEKLGPIFRDVFDDASIQIREDMKASDIEQWDSLNHINLIVAVEKRFKVKFTTRDINALRNVGDFVDLIERIQPRT